MLFSADSPLAALVAAPADVPVVVETAAAETGAPVARAVDAAAPAEARPGELVVVDAGVPRLDALLAGLAVPGGPEVVVLDGGAGDADEALARLGDLLAGRANLGAVHLVSHGGAGELELAGVPVTLVDLLAANEAVTGWADAFADGADFLIYGCDVAAGQAGRAFVDTLALLTGTDVAASTDLTGAAGAGGDWRLEYARGTITTDVAAGTALRDGYDATLAIRTVSSFDDAGAGTLRQAIIDSVDGDEIRFSGPGTIVLQSALPEIGATVTIDATIGTGYAGAPRVTLDGGAAGAGAHGLVLGAGSEDSTVRGLAIVNFGGDGVRLVDSGEHTLQSNRVGTDGANDLGNGARGIFLVNSADNLIGGPTRADGNLVSGNGWDGIALTGGASARNVVQNNLIGTDAGGNGRIGNGLDGVALFGGPSDNTIGGGVGRGNVISGNYVDGVGLAAVSDNTVAGNLIGLGADGTTELGNARNGIVLRDAGDNLVGTDGTAATAANTISGNGESGVYINGNDAGFTTGNTVVGNRIGTDPSGTLERGNTLSGVTIMYGASGNTIGGSAGVGLGNLISGNDQSGVFVTHDGTDGNLVLGNRIGTTDDGLAPLANGHAGVYVSDGATGTRIGGTVDEGNTISGNVQDGVVLTLAGAGNTVSGNVIGLGVDGDTVLGNGGNGVTVYRTSDAWVGADGVEGEAGTTLAGNTISGNGDAANPGGGTGLVIAGGGSGATGNTVAGNRIGTDATGMFSRANALSGVSLVQGSNANTVGGERGTGLGNLISGNGHNGVFVADAVTDGNRILGNLVGTNENGRAGLNNGRDGIHVREGATDTRIGGTVAEGNTVSGNASRGIALDGAGAGSIVSGNLVGLGNDGASLLGNAGDGVVVRMTSGALIGADGAGLAGNTISDNAGSGVLIDGVSSEGTSANTVTGNRIGTDPTGTLDRGNGFSGVAVVNGASANTVGGAAAGLGNVISGNAHDGVHVANAGTDDNRILGNLVGTGGSGTSALGNGHGGVYVGDGAARTVIGGTLDEGNTIAGNARTGIILSRAGDGSVVSGNLVGLGSDGAATLGNGVAPDGGGDGGVMVVDTTGALIGSDPNGRAGNTISGNTGNGVELRGTDTSATAVAGNRIGTDANGIDARPNTGDGVLVHIGAHDNLVGGPFVGYGNIISGNAFDGVELSGAGTDRNTVSGNVIGLAEGTGAALGNGRHGVVIHDGAQDSRIGGDGAALFGNVISGNAGSGVLIHGNGGASGPTSGNLVTANGIGVDVLGGIARPNGEHGVHVIEGASGNAIGGATPVLGNHVSGNGAHGVRIAGAATADNRLENNIVGLDRAGAAAMPNRFDGVVVDGAPRTVIGGATGLGNTISGNGNDGVEILNAGSDGALVAGNTIGLSADGTAALGNGRHGVVLYRDVRDALIGTDGARGAPNTISGNGAIGIVIDGAAEANTRNNTIGGNFVGTDAAGRLERGNEGAGLTLLGGARDNVVGGAGAMRNVFAANGTHGVHLFGGNTSANVIAGNLIGTDVDGTADLGNGQDGVRIDVGASANTIGGNRNVGLGNLISGNDAYGIALVGTGTDDNRLLGNRIGTSADGDAALGNVQDGVFVLQGAAGTRIGGAAPGEGNLVSGNGDAGVEIIGEGTDDTVVRGNRIGTNAAGDEALGNARHGVILYRGVQGTRIGGAAAEQGNLISGNVADGIYIDGFGGGTLRDSVVAGNLIGTDATGASALGNGGDGIEIRNGATTNTIGGTAPGAANTVSGNRGSGLYVTGTGTDANRIVGNRIGTSADGAAELGNVLSGIAVDGGTGTVIGGDRGAGAGNVISGNGAHGIYVAGTVGDPTVGTAVQGNRIGTDAAGTRSIANGVHGVSIAGGAVGSLVGGDRDDGRGNLVSGNVFVGVAVEAGRATRVLGNLVGTDASGSAPLGNGTDGVHVLGGASDTAVGGAGAGDANLISGNGESGVRIGGDGTLRTTVAGNRIGTDADGLTALGNGGAGVRVDAAGATVIGDGAPGAGNLVSGNGLSGIRVTDVRSGGTTILGNVVGLDANGGAVLENENDGIRIDDSVGTRVGGTGAGAGNTVSGNDDDGISVGGAASANTVIAGNRVGTDPSGTADLGNGGAGIRVEAGDRARIGGTAAGAGNLVSGNDDDGVSVEGTASDTVLYGNRIGTNAAGDAALGNDGAGVRVSDAAHGTLVGGAADGGGNLVSGNAGDGVRVDDADDAKIVNNLIGTTADGTAALPNEGAGVRIGGDAERTVVGRAGNGNLVSGNVERGIEIGGDEVLDTLVRANLVGTDADGAAALPNGGEGVLVHDGATGTRIGGDADAGQGNLISGHALDSGVAVNGADTTDTWIQGNRIGTTTDGDASLGNLNGVSVSLATDTRVGGAGAGNLISGNLEDGVLVLGAASVQVLGNRIGTTGDGLAANPNGRHGVQVNAGARDVVVGGAAAGARNVIGGNGADGLRIGGSTDTAVLGNHVGVDAGGNAELGNGRHGIWVVGATDAAIGGAGAGAGNVVSGNAAAGIHVGVDSSGATVAGNTVGLGADGATALGNGSRGIAVLGADATVGGAATGAGNVVSANDGVGVLIDGADGARVLGNAIGLDRDGALDRGNRLSGVVVRDADGVVIGEAGAGNTVSGNGGVGVELGRTNGSSVAGNRIGTSADGTIDVGNDRDGVRIFDDSAGNLVGGAAPAAANTIRGNGGAGIAVLGAGSTGNALLLNVLVGNDGLGIDIAAVGTDPNDVLDADAGANDRVNRPELERAGTDEAGRVEVDGRVETTPNTDVRVDVYATGSEDGSGHGEAQRHLGSITFRTGDDGTVEGRLPLSATLARGEGVTATLTILSPDGTPGSTSEFARNVAARELDVAPAITSGDFTVAENAVVAGTVTADDANGDALLYSVTGGADAALFTIDANAGTLRFASAPDAEAPADADGDGVHEVRVAATDGWSSAERDVTVTVEDADEADVGAVGDADPTADELAEDAAIGSAAGITASAEDADVDDSVTYALANDADGLFAIDATSGVVTLAGALDAEKATSHDIVVRAISTDGSSFERVFAITVTDVDESDVGPVSDVDLAAAVLAEDAPVGSSAGITASADDADVDDSVTYSLADDAGGLFAIDAASGTVTLAGALDAETSISHEIVVRATSTDGSVSERAFAIAVRDVDEADVGPVDGHRSGRVGAGRGRRARKRRRHHGGC